MRTMFSQYDMQNFLGFVISPASNNTFFFFNPFSKDSLDVSFNDFVNILLAGDPP